VYIGRRLAAVTAVTALAALVTALPAVAIGAGGSGGFGLTPAPLSNGSVPPYFTMTLSDGQSATGTAIISNPGNTTQKLKISTSLGVTAANSGSAFSGAFGPCSRISCWVTVTPSQVTLAAGTEEALRVSVHVPAGVADGQYLAGLTAAPVSPPAPVKVGSNGKSSAQAIIIQEVNVGVAVTVGQLSRLTTRMQIPVVTGQDIGTTARLNIQLDNTGQTFARGTGTAACTSAGKQYAYKAYADTVLPGDSAAIAVNAPGLPEGATVPCTVHITYGPGLVASWTGTVALPSAPHTRTVHIGPGSYAVVPTSSSLPPWVIAAVVVGIAILLVIAFLLWRNSRNRRGGQVTHG
jgi:hypothetical protein